MAQSARMRSRGTAHGAPCCCLPLPCSRPVHQPAHAGVIRPEAALRAFAGEGGQQGRAEAGQQDREQPGARRAAVRPDQRQRRPQRHDDRDERLRPHGLAHGQRLDGVRRADDQGVSSNRPGAQWIPARNVSSFPIMRVPGAGLTARRTSAADAKYHRKPRVGRARRVLRIFIMSLQFRPEKPALQDACRTYREDQ